MPVSGAYMNFQMNAADTRGSSTGMISTSDARRRQRPCTRSSRNTASAIPTSTAPATVTTSHSTDTSIAFRKRRSDASRMKLRRPTYSLSG